MNYVLKGANVFLGNSFKKEDLIIDNGKVRLGTDIPSDAQVYNCDGYFIFPGFIDVHVHLREPGFFYKETIETGTLSAARGGYTHVFSMANLSPVPDDFKNLKEQLDIIEKSANVHVTPYGAITKGEQGKELAKMSEMAEYVGGFSDDGRGVQDIAMMEKAMYEAKRLGKIIVAHCEENSLLKGGYIHDGEYAKAHGHKGICSESEWQPIKRDLELAEKTGCRYHVCHISTKESVEVIRAAKARGVDVTCETAPHYLVLNDTNLQEDGRFKMNPPIRSEEDRLALIEGIKDGTIDMIATDHAPHSKEEKAKGLAGSAMGVVGLETAFPVMYTEFVKTGIISLEKLVELMHTNPKKRFSVKDALSEGEKACFTVYNLDKKYIVNPEEFKTQGRSTPFAGREVYGRCVMTVADGEMVWKEVEDK